MLGAVRARGPLSARRDGRPRARPAARRGRRRRQLGAAADRLFRALAEDDARALAPLVAAPGLRARLPKSLVAEPICEQAGPAGPRGPVTVAATELRGGRGVPWVLTWTRGPAGWRLTGAAPVLE